MNKPIKRSRPGLGGRRRNESSDTEEEEERIDKDESVEDISDIDD
jgi:hypothetical protein